MKYDILITGELDCNIPERNWLPFKRSERLKIEKTLKEKHNVKVSKIIIDKKT